MRKILFLIAGAAFSINTFGQTIVSENFNAFTAGNAGSDTTATTAGQGGYYLYTGTVADYQIAVIDAAHGNSLRITSGAGYSSTAITNNRYVLKPVSTTATAGNDILKGSLQIYTGPATGAGIIECIVTDASMGIVGINYDFATKKIMGMGRLTPVTTGTAGFYNIPLGTATYPANTWISVSFTYNKTTGACSWTYPEGTYTFSNAAYTVSPGLTPTQLDFISLTNTGNTVANQSAVDNINLSFVNVTTLDTNEVKSSRESLSIYPNPVVDYLTVKSDSKVSKVEVYDMAGRKTNTTLNGDKVDVTHLNSGNYIINIETKEGKTSKKFIKK
ncbi:T9SS type A sorting domain-containing protein [Chryseobacterium oranimense]|uniref:T9SS type A sorting domain-containing protein n=1 Tax=Chryseobacterium oranimense TaxID=421058 RepID=UPI0021B05E0E|nr:T9SS type A sorting domain-containing protein [Chryseobacterium oranimense]UWX61673.1 T9SS type A sorting domain-containing protein [Chryseobacterium oranimense]